MYIFPIKYHAKCSARLFQEYPRQVYTVCLFFLRKTEGDLASQKGDLGTQRGDLAYFLGGIDVYWKSAIQIISEQKHSMLFFLGKTEGALGGDLGDLTIS